MYFRNAFNLGLLLLTCPRALEIEDGEAVEFDAHAARVLRGLGEDFLAPLDRAAALQLLRGVVANSNGESGIRALADELGSVREIVSRLLRGFEAWAARGVGGMRRFTVTSDVDAALRELGLQDMAKEGRQSG